MNKETIQNGVDLLNQRFMDKWLNDVYGTIDKDYNIQGVESAHQQHYTRTVTYNPCAEIPLPQYLSMPPVAWNNWLNSINDKIEGGITMFNVNDEVIVVKNEYEQFIGLEGVVKELSKSNDGVQTFGVVFEKLKVGHDLGGKCKFGQGWYLLEDEIELRNQSRLCRMIEKNEDLLKNMKDGSLIVSSNRAEYQVRKNGALTFLTEGARKVFVYKDGATSPLILNCISEDDRIVTLHLMEAFRILPMHTICQTRSGIYGLSPYDQGVSDALEAEMFSPPVVEIKTEDVLPILDYPPVQEGTKVYKSEEEIYAELGITKKD